MKVVHHGQELINIIGPCINAWAYIFYERIVK